MAALSGSSQTCLEPASAPYQHTASVLASALARLSAFLPLGSPDPSMTTYQTLALHHKNLMLYEILRNMDGFYVSPCLSVQDKEKPIGLQVSLKSRTFCKNLQKLFEEL